MWTELSPMLIARSGSAACVLNGHIYVVGESRHVWTELSPMLIARSGSAACVLNGHIYVVGWCSHESLCTRTLW